jgi:hypothetical protein
VHSGREGARAGDEAGCGRVNVSGD